MTENFFKDLPRGSKIEITTEQGVSGCLVCTSLTLPANEESGGLRPITKTVKAYADEFEPSGSFMETITQVLRSKF